MTTPTTSPPHAPRPRRLAGPTACLVLLVLAGSTAACGRQDSPRPAASERLVLSVAEQPLSAPVYVAEAAGLFAREGLDVRLVGRSSGKASLDDLLAGRADVATAAETPILFAALDRRPVCILGTLAVTERNLALVARRDRGLRGPEDLPGKRVGVAPRTNSEFFLDVLLIYNWIDRRAVVTVPLAPEQMVPALAAGQVDAISIWEPLVSEARRRLGPDAVPFTGEGIYLWTWNLVTRRELAERRPEALRRLLRALLAANGMLAAEPAASIRLVADRLGLPPEQLREIWGIYQFGLHLDQSLLLNLEGQTRWAIRNRYADLPALPNYLDSICPQELAALDPSAVTLIHRGGGEGGR